MKNLLFIVLLAMLAGCNDKYDSLVASAQPPVLYFANDTLHIREKDPTNINATGKGILVIGCTPAGRQFNLSFSDTTDKLHFVYRGNQLNDSQPFVVTDEDNSLFVYADAPGIYAVDFFLMDQLGKTTTRKLIVSCSPGTRPIAALTWEMSSRTGADWLYYFNAEGSRQPYGTIMTYHYLFSNDTVVVNRPVLKYFFHSAGSQPLSFFVVDDLGNSSDTVHYSIDIP